MDGLTDRQPKMYLYLQWSVDTESNKSHETQFSSNSPTRNWKNFFFLMKVLSFVWLVPADPLNADKLTNYLLIWIAMRPSETKKYHWKYG